MNIPEQTCWNCEHFEIRNQEPDWSDVTPGSNFSIECYKNVWKFDTYESSQEDFKKCMELGFTCTLYEKKQ